MTHQDIQAKYSSFKSDIETYVKDNAKYKIGDIVIISFDKFKYVITQVGYCNIHGIQYFGRRVKKDGEVSFISMWSDSGLKESFISKVDSMDISELKFDKSIKIKLI